MAEDEENCFHCKNLNFVRATYGSMCSRGPGNYGPPCSHWDKDSDVSHFEYREIPKAITVHGLVYRLDEDATSKFVKAIERLGDV